MIGRPWRIGLRRAAVAALAVVALTAIAGVSRSPAQDIPASVLRQLQGRADGSDDTPPPKSTVQTFQPVVPGTAPPPSQLEVLYSQRAGRPLTQFGYDFIGVASAVSVVPTGEMKDSYVLGVGDELVIALRGQENSTYRQRVTSNGQVLVPKLAPVIAAGRTFGAFRSELEARVAQAYLSTNVYVSLGELHQFTVLVTGEVRSPGARIVNALASPLDVILLSGGISKQGSLRNVRLVHDGVTRTIDLYAIIAQGGGNLGPLRDGDRIYVPPLGPTVAIAGQVKHPGIYELRSGARSVPASALIRMAGGVELAGGYNLSKAELRTSGATSLIPLPQGGNVASGEVLFVDAASNTGAERVQLDGEVSLTGTRPLSTARNTSEVFRSTADLSPDAYGAFALIVRRDLVTNTRTLVPFSIAASINRTSPVALQSFDRIVVLKMSEIRALAAEATSDANVPYSAVDFTKSDNSANRGDQTGGNNTRTPSNAPGTLPPGAIAPGKPNGQGANLPAGSQQNRPPAELTPELAALAQGERLRQQQSGVEVPPDGSLLSGPNVPESNADIVTRLATTLGVPKTQLLRAAGDNLVLVLDEVAAPGPYLAAKGTTVDELVRLAGGPLQAADLSSVEITSTILDQNAGRSQTSRNTFPASGNSLALVMLHPRDVVRLRSVYVDRDQGTVTLAGELRYPGVFDISRSERLSSVLERAGGLTEVAFPYGAIFTRKAAALAERQGNERAVRELQTQLITVATSKKQNHADSDVEYLSSLVEQLRDTPALGRVMVTADPVVLAAKPELDLILQPGDALFIPKRPASVVVTGEVLNPGSFQFQSNASLSDYLRMAGGPTQGSDTDRTFIVFPDGSATPMSDSWLTFRNTGHIPPGSTIVIPRDLRPFDWGEFIKDATQILSQLAVTAASLSVLRTN